VVATRAIATAAMAAPAPVQRKAVGRAAVIAVLTVLTIAALAPLAALIVLGRRLRLAAGDEGGQALDIAVVGGNGLLPLLIVLRLRLLLLRLILLRLVLLLARIKRLRLGREGLAAHRRLIALAIVVIVVRGIAARVAALLLVIGLRLAKLLLRGSDQAEIMLGVLIIIFGGDRVAGTLRIARELKIFLRDMRRGAANFYVLSVGLVHSRQRILMMPTLAAAVTTAHAFILTVSHGLLFRNPLDWQRQHCRRFSSPDFKRSMPNKA
jgi:hypothetical protein